MAPYQHPGVPARGRVERPGPAISRRCLRENAKHLTSHHTVSASRMAGQHSAGLCGRPGSAHARRRSSLRAAKVNVFRARIFVIRLMLPKAVATVGVVPTVGVLVFSNIPRLIRKSESTVASPLAVTGGAGPDLSDENRKRRLHWAA